MYIYQQYDFTKNIATPILVLDGESFFGCSTPPPKKKEKEKETIITPLTECEVYALL